MRALKTVSNLFYMFCYINLHSKGQIRALSDTYKCQREESSQNNKLSATIKNCPQQ